MIEHGHALWLLENEGAIFENQFWRDFYRSLLNGAKRGAINKLTLIVLCLALFTQGRVFAAERVDLVILVDLSQSVGVRDHNGQSEFQKNLRGVSRVLASLPAGSHVAVFGITDDSFGRPYPLLQAELSGDEGYFKERLAKGRGQLVHAWEERSRNPQPEFRHTDILGALLMASQHFEHSPGVCKKMLIVFSDMRQATSVLDLERAKHIEAVRTIEGISNAGLEADLHGVEVYAFGVDAAANTIAHWQDLKRFWEAYFRHEGAALIAYSTLRESPI